MCVFLGHSLDGFCEASSAPCQEAHFVEVTRQPHLFAGIHSRLQRESELPSSLNGKEEKGSELRFQGGASSCVGC